MGWWAKLRGLEEFEPQSKDKSDIFTDDEGVTWGPCGCDPRNNINCPTCRGTGMRKIN